MNKKDLSNNFFESVKEQTIKAKLIFNNNPFDNGNIFNKDEVIITERFQSELLKLLSLYIGISKEVERNNKIISDLMNLNLKLNYNNILDFEKLCKKDQ